MLNLVTPEHFRPLLARTSVLYLPDGSALPIQIQQVTDAPKASVPGSPRTAFSVLLDSLEPTDFVDGLCRLPLAQTCLEQVFVSREPAMGRDNARGYFCIVFN
ncbi:MULTISPECIES: hypothetical protein [Pseudomonas]|jgi:hypothetical protein|uniref:Uncharacterized protein n=2 Tax=Gammaproteobacteria TaxID=1236 RepID=A0A0R2ZVK0_PSEVE|nr:MULTISPECIES: hypothetical protein [Pseudomonas]SEB68414.1 hypothetical protein SAMN04490199_2273 [Pseudomonas marginalis]AQY63634.1 hypothetical protein PverR02_00755 [Pseudomonas veronii]KRP64751.1 hypothetical protein TU80_29565 [Pseudomonas veronii]MCI1740652.1 hypothetical protein [Pseudomonas veronii]MCT8964751.1 hypothetical protein [Pseudomonas veronii]